MKETLAGRKTNELVAKNVMGLIPGVDFGNFGGHDWYDVLDDYNTVRCRHCGKEYGWIRAIEIQQRKNTGQCYREPPPYSDTLAIAWKMVEHLRLKGYRILINEELDGQQFVVMFVGNGFAYTGRAATVPLALCRAALRVSISTPSNSDTAARTAR